MASEQPTPDAEPQIEENMAKVQSKEEVIAEVEKMFPRAKGMIELFYNEQKGDKQALIDFLRI